MNLVITEQELVVRKSQGTVQLCKPCKDMRGKLVMLGHFTKGRPEIIYSVCPDCMKLMQGCSACRQKK